MRHNWNLQKVGGGGGGGLFWENSFQGGGMDIFWNHTIFFILIQKDPRKL